MVCHFQGLFFVFKGEYRYYGSKKLFFIDGGINGQIRNYGGFKEIGVGSFGLVIGLFGLTLCNGFPG